MRVAAFGAPACRSAEVLAELGVEEATVRSAIKHVLGTKEMPIPTKIIPTSRVKIVIEQAFRLCSAAGDPKISTPHLLLGLVVEEEGIAAHVLKSLRATRERIETEKTQLTEPRA